MPPTLTPQDFVAKWRRSELKESAADREHFIDLCRLIGHATPAEAELRKRTLTNLYNARPARLDSVHRKRDAAVFAAYVWPADLSDKLIFERLPALTLA